MFYIRGVTRGSQQPLPGAKGEKRMSDDNDLVSIESAETPPLKQKPPGKDDYINKVGRTIFDVFLILYENGLANVFLTVPVVFFAMAIVSGNLKKWDHFYLVSAAVGFCWCISLINAIFRAIKARRAK